MDKDEAYETVYGMPHNEWKDKYQTPATDEQMKRMDESLLKNKEMKSK